MKINDNFIADSNDIIVGSYDTTRNDNCLVVTFDKAADMYDIDAVRAAMQDGTLTNLYHISNFGNQMFFSIQERIDHHNRLNIDNGNIYIDSQKVSEYKVNESGILVHGINKGQVWLCRKIHSYYEDMADADLQRICLDIRRGITAINHSPVEDGLRYVGYDISLYTRHCYIAGALVTQYRVTADYDENGYAYINCGDSAGARKAYIYGGFAYVVSDTTNRATDLYPNTLLSMLYETYKSELIDHLSIAANKLLLFKGYAIGEAEVYTNGSFKLHNINDEYKSRQYVIQNLLKLTV